MKRFRGIIMFIGLFLIRAIPFSILIDSNRTATFAEVLHRNSCFRFFSVIFGIQFLLSVIGALLLFIKLNEETEFSVISFLVLAFTAVSVMVFYSLNDFGDYWTSGGRDAFSRLMHPSWKTSSFYICMTISFIQIELGLAALLHVVSDELGIGELN